MVDTVYTIGYAGFAIDDFMAVLRQNKIALVVDVRSDPHSQWRSEYNMEHMQLVLKKQGIYYRNYAEEFGARQENRNFYPNGYLDFELFSGSSQFRNGVNKLVNSMKKHYCFVLMCAEKDPFECHRCILVARAFHELGYKIVHLLPGGETCTQEDIELRLLNRFEPNRDQGYMFEEMLSEREYLSRAYRKQNAAIGFKPEDEEI